MPVSGDPGRNPHRTGTAWTLGTVSTILSNPRYTGHQVWNRQRTDKDLADPADVSLGHKSGQRWNLPDGWVISREPAHPALISVTDFIAAQDINAARGPAPRDDVSMLESRRYLLSGLLVCGTCGRRMESAWSNGKPAYRCRHGHTSASAPGPGRPGNAFVRENRIVAHLPGLHLLLTEPAGDGRRRRTRRGVDVRHQVAEDVIRYLREQQITLNYDPAAATLRGRPDHHLGSKLTGSEAQHRKGEAGKEPPVARRWRQPRARVTSRHTRKQADMGIYCVRGDTHLTYMIDIALTTEFVITAGGGR